MGDVKGEEEHDARNGEELAMTRLRRGSEPTTLRRRSFLRAALAAGAGVVIGAQMSGCSESPPRRVDDEPAHAAARPTPTGSKVLLAYFSRAGENYYYGGRTDLKVGNTEVLAGTISRLIGCDARRIEPVDPYPDG